VKVLLSYPFNGSILLPLGQLWHDGNARWGFWGAVAIAMVTFEHK
jgi:hypothetical protein